MADPTKTRRRTARLIAVGIALLCVFVAELLGYAWARMQCVKVGYEISALTREQQRLNELQTNLRVELARLKAPQRIIRIGRELGLALPTPQQTVVMP